jgi:serine/threonine protein kinase/tetratricopeptide (TPR) repeat protein
VSEREIFIAALQHDDPRERSAYLNEVCAHDAALRQRIELLLEMHHDAGAFLEASLELSTETFTDVPEDEPGSGQLVGSHIGPYKLLQPLGEGGMGAVYVAEQEHPVNRRVALKLIKPGMDSVKVLRRFQAEQQALALMDHTNIAKVFDAGISATGHPYFAMELVKGEPITKYCNTVRLSIRDRLVLFIRVCAAIQHAHQKGVIHRDIKPSNILVCMQDSQPVPKVIDFGVAKALHSKLGDRTMYTEIGSLVGTLEYMSPEQAQLSAMDIDTRADVYGLGVLLYELLTGTTPLDRNRLRRVAYNEAVQIIREEEPPKPSTRLTQSNGSLASLAAQRRTEPARLTSEVRGELDWIVMKCLEKDRTRRYETANGLARDVQRYLADEPVEACPPSVGYRLRKLVRRHRGPVLAAALVLIALLAGVVGTTWGLIRAERALQSEALARALAEANERKALEEKRIALAVGTFLQQDLLCQANPADQAEAVRQAGGRFETSENPTVKELLDRAAAELMPGKIEVKFPRQPVVQASILKSVGTTYWGIGEYAKAVEFLTRASDTYRQAFDVNHLDSLETLDYLAAAYQAAGRTAEAAALFEQVYDARQKTLGADHRSTLTTLESLAGTYLCAGQTAAAVDLFERVRAARLKTLEADHPDTLETLDNLARAYLAAGRTADAVALYEQVSDARQRQLGAEHPYTLITLHGLAGGYFAAGQTARASMLYEQVRDTCVKKLGADHPLTLSTQHNLAQTYQEAGKTAEATALYERLRNVCPKKLGADHPLSLSTLDNLAGAYLVDRKTAQAVALLEQVRDARVKRLGADHPHTLVTLNNLAGAYLSAGKTAEAIALYEQVRDARVKKLGADHPHTLDTLASLARAYQAAGKPDQALALLEQAAVGIENRQFLHRHAETIVRALSKCQEQLKHYDQAEAWRRKWLAVIKDRSGPDSLPYADELAALGLYLLEHKKWTAAEPVLRECLALREKSEPDAWTTFSTRSMLGGALFGQTKCAEAEALLVQGYDGLRQRATRIPHESKSRLTEALDRLAQFYEFRGKWAEAASLRAGLEGAKADARRPDKP